MEILDSASDEVLPLFDPNAVTESLDAIIPLQGVQLASLQRGDLTIPRRGQGTDQVGSRGYIPGDDLRYIDWLQTARDPDHELQTKQFNKEVMPPPFVVVTDYLQTRFETTVPFVGVSERNLALSAALTLLRTAQAQRLPIRGIIGAGDRGDMYELWRPKQNRYLLEDIAEGFSDFIHRQDEGNAKDPNSRQDSSRLTATLDYLSDLTVRNSIVAVVADFRDEMETPWIEPIHDLQSAGNSVIAIEVTNPWKSQFPSRAPIERIRTLSGTHRLSTRSERASLPEIYQNVVRERQQVIDDCLAKLGITHVKLSTTDHETTDHPWRYQLEQQLEAATKA